VKPFGVAEREIRKHLHTKPQKQEDKETNPTVNLKGEINHAE
jgi:hypothetical protein